MVDTQGALLSLGAIILVGLAGAVLFSRTKVSDVLLLIGAGVLLGPLLHFLDVEPFLELFPIVAILTVVVIVFDAGLTLRLEHLAKEGLRGILFSFLAFVDSVLVTVILLSFVVPWSLSTRILLGIVLGSTGTSVVLSMLKGMKVSHRGRTITVLETGINDLFVILGVLMYSALLVSGRLEIGDAIVFAGGKFLLGTFLGGVFGVILVQFLGRLPKHPSQYLFTLAILLFLYFATERLGGAGILAVLMVGIAVANAEVATPAKKAPAPPRETEWDWSPLFHRDLQVLQGEVFFFLRAFFFVGLGATLDLDLVTPEFLALSALLTVALFLGRYVAVAVCTAGSRLAARDVFAMFVLGPRGLSTAALASVPFLQFGLVDTRDFAAYATIVVLMTNLVATVGVWLHEHVGGGSPTGRDAHPTRP